MTIWKSIQDWEQIEPKLADILHYQADSANE